MPIGSKFRWIKVFDKSSDHVQPLESSNFKFGPSKNCVLLSLHPMDENLGQHEKVFSQETSIYVRVVSA